MPIGDYRDVLLRKADDAAQRAKKAAEPVVKAAWQRIEASYRMTAASAVIEIAVLARDQPSHHTDFVEGSEVRSVDPLGDVL